MGRLSDYKKVDEIAALDLDKGCRRIIDTSRPSRRRLRDVLRRQARKRLERGDYGQSDLTEGAMGKHEAISQDGAKGRVCGELE